MEHFLKTATEREKNQIKGERNIYYNVLLTVSLPITITFFMLKYNTVYMHISFFILNQSIK